jgi:hypothetical protein
MITICFTNDFAHFVPIARLKKTRKTFASGLAVARLQNMLILFFAGGRMTNVIKIITSLNLP